MSLSSKVALFVMVGLMACYLVGYFSYRKENVAWMHSRKYGPALVIGGDTREQRFFAKLFWPCIKVEEAWRLHQVEKEQVWPSP